MRSSSYPLIVLACLLLLGLAACGSSEQDTVSTAAPVTSATYEPTPTTAAPGTYITVDVLAAFNALKADPGAQLVDVREPEEWATGVPVGAVLISLGELEQRAPAELAEDKPVYVICRSGNRSRAGADILIKLGYSEVYNVDGGVKAWTSAGLPMEAYAP